MKATFTLFSLCLFLTLFSSNVFSQCGPCSATHELANSIISLYPNPAVDVITVDVQGSITVMATLYDFSGRKVLSSEISQINVDHVPPGVYLLEVKDVNSGQQIIERIVIGR